MTASEYREKMGISQNKAARMLGLTQGYLSLLEGGEALGSVQTWEAIRILYGIPKEEMWDAIPGLQ